MSGTTGPTGTNTGLSPNTQRLADSIESSRLRAMDAKNAATSWTVPLLGIPISKGPFQDKTKIAQMDNYLNFILPELLKCFANRFGDDQSASA